MASSAQHSSPAGAAGPSSSGAGGTTGTGTGTGTTGNVLPPRSQWEEHATSLLKILGDDPRRRRRNLLQILETFDDDGGDDQNDDDGDSGHEGGGGGGGGGSASADAARSFYEFALDMNGRGDGNKRSGRSDTKGGRRDRRRRGGAGSSKDGSKPKRKGRRPKRLTPPKKGQSKKRRTTSTSPTKPEPAAAGKAKPSSSKKRKKRAAAADDDEKPELILYRDDKGRFRRRLPTEAEVRARRAKRKRDREKEEREKEEEEEELSGEDGGDDEEASSGSSNEESSEEEMSEEDFLQQHNDLCQVCELGGEVLCCSTCNLVFHMECVRPVVKKLPPDDWSCAYCIAAGLRGYKGHSSVKRKACQAVRTMDSEQFREERLEATRERLKVGSQEDDEDDDDDDGEEGGDDANKKEGGDGSEEDGGNESEGGAERTAAGEEEEGRRRDADGGDGEDRKESAATRVVGDGEDPSPRRDRGGPDALVGGEDRAAAAATATAMATARGRDDRTSTASVSSEGSSRASISGRPRRVPAQELLDALSPTIDVNMPRSTRRVRHQPALYDPQLCSASRWQSDEAIHFFEGTGSTSAKGERDGAAARARKKDRGVCSFCKGDESIPACCFCSCRVCFRKGDEDKVVQCDKCGTKYHTFCLDRPLDGVPTSWHCESCRRRASASARNKTADQSADAEAGSRPSTRAGKLQSSPPGAPSESSAQEEHRATRETSQSKKPHYTQPNPRAREAESESSSSSSEDDEADAAGPSRKDVVEKGASGKHPDDGPLSNYKSGDFLRYSQRVASLPPKPDHADSVSRTRSDGSGGSSNRSTKQSSRPSSAPPQPTRRSARPVKRNTFLDDIGEGEQHLRSSRSSSLDQDRKTKSDAATVSQAVAEENKRKAAAAVAAEQRKRAKAEADLKAKQEEEVRLRVEEEAKRKAEAAKVEAARAKAKVEEARVEAAKAESLRRAKEESARLKAEEEARRKKAEEERMEKERLRQDQERAAREQSGHEKQAAVDEKAPGAEVVTLASSTQHADMIISSAASAPLPSAEAPTATAVSSPPVIPTPPEVSASSVSTTDHSTVSPSAPAASHSAIASPANTTESGSANVEKVGFAVAIAATVVPPVEASTPAESTGPVKVPRRKPGARECMQISRRFHTQVIPQKYMDTLLDYCTRGKVEHLIRMRERLDEHSRMLEAQLAGLEGLVQEKGEVKVVPTHEISNVAKPEGA